MQGRLVRICMVAAGAALLSGCGATRHIPQGSYLLVKNTVETDRNTPKKSRITESDLEKYIQQSPNSRFLGTNLNLWLYNSVKPESKTWWARNMHKMGQAPVILDTVLTRASADYIGKYVRSRGYFDGAATYALDTAKKRARVTYAITQGAPYRIGNIKYDYRDRSLEPVLQRDSARTLIRRGDVFDMEVLDRERSRIMNYLREGGYFNFSINNVQYLADSTVGGRTVDVTVVIHQAVSYTADGVPVSDNNSIYRISRINVFPDNDITRDASDPGAHRADTLEYMGLNIVYHDKLRVKKEVLRRAVSIYPNLLYNTQDVSRTNAELMRLKYFRSAHITFTDEPDSTRKMVTFIRGDQTVQTPEKYIVCNIYCTPSLRQGYNLGLEATFTSDYYGLSATLGYRNRSLFRGVEMFDVSFTGSYDFMRVKGESASFEFGGTTSITFPRFILPFRPGKLRKLPNQTSKLELSVNAQRRPYYHRVLSNASWGYSWSGNKFTNFSLRPIDVGVVKVNYISQEFWESLQNDYIRYSYEPQLLAGISASWSYVNNTTKRGNSFGVRLNLETMGNLLEGLCLAFGKKTSGQDYYELLGIRFAQYARADLSIANAVPLSPKFTLAWRVYGGVGLTYGNSRDYSMPYDRLFYAGGSNSMRGWAARTLGPGSDSKPQPAPGEVYYPSQLGNMRLEANLEARFPLFSIFRGALFVDAGNVWMVGRGDYSDAARFQMRDFYRELGLNTGLGLRVDISMTVVRLDWGIRLHDPNLPSGDRWIRNLRLDNTALSLAVGYPF